MYILTPCSLLAQRSNDLQARLSFPETVFQSQEAPGCSEEVLNENQWPARSTGAVGMPCPPTARRSCNKGKVEDPLNAKSKCAQRQPGQLCYYELRTRTRTRPCQSFTKRNNRATMTLPHACPEVCVKSPYTSR